MGEESEALGLKEGGDVGIKEEEDCWNNERCLPIRLARRKMLMLFS